MGWGDVLWDVSPPHFAHSCSVPLSLLLPQCLYSHLLSIPVSLSQTWIFSHSVLVFPTPSPGFPAPSSELLLRCCICNARTSNYILFKDPQRDQVEIDLPISFLCISKFGPAVFELYKQIDIDILDILFYSWFISTFLFLMRAFWALPAIMSNFSKSLMRCTWKTEPIPGTCVKEFFNTFKA